MEKISLAFGFKKKPPKKLLSKLTLFYKSQVFVNWFI